MPDLTDFLLAQIAEDEAVARACQQQSWVPTIEKSGDWRTGETFDMGRIDCVFVDSEDSRGLVATSEHVIHAARHDPARVLAECEVKRRIVAEHPHRFSQGADSGYGCIADDEWECLTCQQQYHWCATLKALAQPHANHPQFQPEWRA
jgi:hypothetical protein